MDAVTLFTCAMAFLALGVAERATNEGHRPEIPLELARRLNNIVDENQLFHELLENTHLELSPDLRGGPMGSSAVMVSGGNSGATMVKQAVCSPENQTVSFGYPDNTDGRYPRIYWPACMKVEQCGGCCNHVSLSCQPIEVKQVLFKVHVLEYINNTIRNKGIVEVPVDKHIKCKCECIVKEQDCTIKQQYDKNNCLCKCTNQENKIMCNNSKGRKHWDPNTCSCSCTNILECTWGSSFSNTTCECEEELPKSLIRDEMREFRPQAHTRRQGSHHHKHQSRRVRD